MKADMRHGAACREGLDECDWPACYMPVCVACSGPIKDEWPLWRAESGGAASGPYCDYTCCTAGEPS